MLMVTLRTERDHIATECFSKTPSFVAGLTPEVKQFFWYLTPYAFNLVQRNLNKIDGVDVISHINMIGVVNSKEGFLNVTTTTLSYAVMSTAAVFTVGKGGGRRVVLLRTLDGGSFLVLTVGNVESLAADWSHRWLTSATF
ncbi:hypothetical protein ACI65C_002316 [Semiaphis heraclei]